MSGCREMRRRVLARLDGELGFEQELALERHLEECARCRAHAAREARLEEALARLPEPASERLDLDAALARIHAGIESGEGAPARRRPVWPWIAAAGAAAALAVWLALPEARPAEPEGVAQEPEGRERDEGRIAAAPSDAEGSTAPAPEQRAASDPSPEPPALEPIDLARLERARAEVRALLVESSAGFEPEGDLDAARAFAARFDERSRALRLQGWPRERLVAGLLDEEDLGAARLAARYLGARGGVAAVRALETALGREGLGGAAVRALADAGAAASLAPALRDEALRALALEGLARVGGEEAAEVLAAELRRELAPDALEALAALGLHAVEPAVRLRREARLSAEQLVALLARIDGAGAELARRLADERPGPRALELAEAAAAVDPAPAVDSIAALIVERGTRERAAALLGSIAHADAFDALARLRDSGRVPLAQLDEALRASVARNAALLDERAARAVEAGDDDEQAALLSLLVESGSPGAAPALARLAASVALEDAERQSAVLALAELGSERELPALAALFARLGPSQRHLAAACLVATQALGGEAACEAALADLPERARPRILDLLRRRPAAGGATVSIFKLARELEPWLAQRARSEWSESS